MRVPEKPPTHRPETYLGIETLDRFVTLYETVNSPAVNGKYLHWDELRRRKPPENLTREEWWAALKFRRQALYKSIPLRDKGGRNFVYANIDSIVQRLHEIDMSVGGHIGMNDPIPNSETRDQFFVSSLMEEAITSSQLEGAQTTRQVAKDMLRSGRKPRDRSERMIVNNYRTMRRILALKDEPITSELVLDIHREVTSDTLDDPSTAGRLRKDGDGKILVMSEDDVLHVPPDASTLDDRLTNFCKFANGKIPGEFLHPVLRSIIVHFWLAYDHPFVDGNGRTARALFYWSMARQSYWLFEFVTISKILLNAPSQYARSYLYTETDENDLTYFLDYQLDVILRGIKELKDYIARKTETIQKLERELKGMRALNPRQRALISHALRHPGHIYTFSSHQTSHNVTYQTSRTDLLDLQEKGLLEGRKVNRTREFRPVPDLEKRLAISG